MGVRLLFSIFGDRAGLSVADFCHPGEQICNKKCNRSVPAGCCFRPLILTLKRLTLYNKNEKREPPHRDALAINQSSSSTCSITSSTRHWSRWHRRSMVLVDTLCPLRIA